MRGINFIIIFFFVLKLSSCISFNTKIKGDASIQCSRTLDSYNVVLPEFQLKGDLITNKLNEFIDSIDICANQNKMDFPSHLFIEITPWKSSEAKGLSFKTEQCLTLSFSPPDEEYPLGFPNFGFGLLYHNDYLIKLGGMEADYPLLLEKGNLIEVIKKTGDTIKIKAFGLRDSETGLWVHSLNPFMETFYKVEEGMLKYDTSTSCDFDGAFKN